MCPSQAIVWCIFPIWLADVIPHQARMCRECYRDIPLRFHGISLYGNHVCVIRQYEAADINVPVRSLDGGALLTSNCHSKVYRCENIKFTHWGLVAIQIKICAEYRDMLPRPRLVCQEPGLRPIGRSPGVPDKSSRGLGSMSRYSAQILICFIAYIFSIFNFSVGLVGNLAELPPCTVPPATVHCYQNEAAQCSSDNQISQHALLRGSRKKHSLAFMPQNWWN